MPHSRFSGEPLSASSLENAMPSGSSSAFFPEQKVMATSISPQSSVANEGIETVSCRRSPDAPQDASAPSFQPESSQMTDPSSSPNPLQSFDGSYAAPGRHRVGPTRPLGNSLSSQPLSAVRLNKEIMASKSTSELLALVNARGKYMDFFNISSAISRTPKLAGVQASPNFLDSHN
jgi:hypothetical protein